MTHNDRVVKIVAISDTHARHQNLYIPQADILIYAGDMTKKGDIEDVVSFNDFLGTLPHQHKIVIAGNHDFCFERTPEKARAVLTNCIYLQDSSITIENIKFYGSPWQPDYHDWAFNLPRGSSLKKKWDLIPEDIDILITHGPPLGHRDKTAHKEHVGCEDLLQAVERIKPKYHVFGHIHEGAGKSKNKHTIFINASTCTRRYKPINPPIVFDYLFT